MAAKRSVVTASAGQPFVIHEHGVYSTEQVRQLLGLSESTLKTARRRDGLVAVFRAKKVYYLGSDLLAWLRGGRRCRPLSKMVEGECYGNSHNTTEGSGVSGPLA